MLKLRQFFSFFLITLILSSAVYAVSVSGTVEGSSGVLLSGATIEASAVDSTIFGQYTTISNSDGSFLLEVGGPGDYFFAVSHPDYQPGAFGPFFIASDTTSVTFVLEMLQTGFASIAGFVKDEVNFSPIENANLAITQAGAVLFSTNSDANGTFQISDIPLGNYTLTVSKEGYASFGQTLNLTSPNNITNINIYLYPDSTGGASVVDGMIYYYDSNGIFSPVPNALVAFNHTTLGLYFEATSNDTGYYKIENIPQGEYVMLVFATGFFMPQDPQFVFINSDTNHIDFQMFEESSVPSGTIEGQVLLDDNNLPVEGAIIQLMPMLTLPPIAFNLVGETDQNGNYSLDNVPAGNYYVQMFYFYGDSTFFPYTEYYDDAQTFDDATTVSIVEDQTTSGIDFGIPVFESFTVTVEGVVADEQANPIGGATVEAILVGNDLGLFWNSYTAESNPDGSYSLVIDDYTSINGGFIVGAYKDGYNQEFYDNQPEIFNADYININSSNDTTVTGINFSLSPYSAPQEYAISGTVSDSFSAPINGAFIAAFGLDNGQFGFGLSDSNGDYSIGNLPEGVYYVLFYATEYAPQFYDGALTWEEASPVDLFSNMGGINAVLPKMTNNSGNPGMISGNILNANNAPLSGVMVSVLNSDGEVTAYSMSNAQGKYNLNGLSEGSYTIIATKVKYNSLSQNISMSNAAGMNQNLNIQLNNSILSADDSDENLPDGYSLENNYPNPFNPSTTISFGLPEVTYVSLKIYNAIGQEVASLINRQMEAGKHSIDFNADELNSGIYFYKLEAGSFVQTRKMVLLK